MISVLWISSNTDDLHVDHEHFDRADQMFSTVTLQKLKKVGKTTRPFRYDLNQIPYDYTVEVRNRFKGLDLIDRVPDELWNEVRDIVQETGIKTCKRDQEMQKSKMAVWGGLTNSCEKKRSEKQRRKGKI